MRVENAGYVQPVNGCEALDKPPIRPQFLGGFCRKQIKDNGIVSNPRVEHLGSASSLCVLAFGIYPLDSSTPFSTGADNYCYRALVELRRRAHSRRKRAAGSELAR